MSFNRRDFLTSTAAVAGGSLFGLPLLSSCMEKENPLKNLGLIPGNTIRGPLEEDYVKALEEVAEIGYKYLDIGSHMGDSFSGFMDLLRRLDLTPIAGGTSMSGMVEEDDLKKLIDGTLEMGKQYLVCYWPWMSDALNLTMDELKQAAEDLNRIGQSCKEAGIRFAFHNHDKEFWPVGDIVPYDYLLVT